MSEPAQREWRFYIDDMIGFAEKVMAYTQGVSTHDGGMWLWPHFFPCIGTHE